MGLNVAKILATGIFITLLMGFAMGAYVYGTFISGVNDEYSQYIISEYGNLDLKDYQSNKALSDAVTPINTIGLLGKLRLMVDLILGDLPLQGGSFYAGDSELMNLLDNARQWFLGFWAVFAILLIVQVFWSKQHS